MQIFNLLHKGSLGIRCVHCVQGNICHALALTQHKKSNTISRNFSQFIQVIKGNSKVLKPFGKVQGGNKPFAKRCLIYQPLLKATKSFL